MGNHKPKSSNQDRSCGLPQDLVEEVLEILGLSAEAVGEHTLLSALGMDSMQVVNVRTAIQNALAATFPLSEVRYKPV